jgi:uncharacterized protein (TIGR02246 family)
VRHVDRDAVTRWVAAYEAAWRAVGTDAVPALFTPDATYRTGPFDTPLRGTAAIRAHWEAGRTGPGERFAMAAEVVAVDPGAATAAVRVEVRYDPPQAGRYRDLWILRFAPDGRCAAFEEWWAAEPPDDAAA